MVGLPEVILNRETKIYPKFQTEVFGKYIVK